MTESLAFLNDNAGAFTVLFSAVVAAATVFYAILTRSLAAETQRLREVQTEPYVEVYVNLSEQWINFLFLYVRNVGSGPAHDVTVKLRPGGDRTGSDLILKELQEAAFLNTGLKYLSPGQQFRSGMVSMVGSFEEKMAAIIHADVHYRDRNGKAFSGRFDLHFSQFRGQQQIGSPPLHQIAKDVGKIQQELHHLSTGFRRLKIDVYSSGDRASETQAMMDRMEERAAQREEERDGIPEE